MPYSRERESKSLFVIRGTLWYVFPKIENVVENIAAIMNESGLLLIVQNFPPLDSNFVGKDILPNYKAIEARFQRHFEVIRSIWYQDLLRNKNDNWYIGLFKKI